MASKAKEAVFKIESIVVVALGEPGMPLIGWAGAVRSTSIMFASSFVGRVVQV
jgi:hypothetical protein